MPTFLALCVEYIDFMNLLNPAQEARDVGVWRVEQFIVTHALAM